MKNAKIHNLEMARKIETAIKASRFSKAEVARRLGTTPQAVNGWVKTGKISKDNLRLLATLIGRTVDSIINDNAVEAKQLEGESYKDMYFLFSDEEMEKITAIAEYEGISIDECVKLLIKKGMGKL